MNDAHSQWILANSEAFDKLVNRNRRWLKNKHLGTMMTGSTEYWLRAVMMAAFELGVQCEKRRP